MAACRQCGSELPHAARFCPACGAAVDAAAGEERKVVTVLFADLADSAALGDGSDPEELRALVQPQLARMRAELERYGGTFEKYVGDAVMAVFGAPVSHEDDPRRAVRAALAIRDAIPGVKVAVNTGEAVVQIGASSGSGEGIATGDVVTTTFRIEEAASPDVVLVGESTYRATEADVEYGERRLLQARGKAEPIAVYEALRARVDGSSVFERPPLAPLVGRQEELRLILDTLSRARAGRTVQLLTLLGTPGIGKSRLVWEVQRALQSEHGLVTWRRGRCLSYGDGVTFWALGEMVKAQGRILESDTVAVAEAKLRRAVDELVADAREAEWVESHLRPLLALESPPRERREEAFAAWRRFFEELAERDPLVLIFEDLHWADEGQLDFLDHLADWATDAPLVLLCTARPELLDRRPTWGARPNAATIALPPLNDAETGALVGHLLRQRLVPAELEQPLLARAEGNPLYAEEFVRMLVDRGLLFREGGSWRLRAEDLPLPESVQGIIAARIDALPRDDKRLLQAAAVIGRGFWLGAVAAVAGSDASIEDAMRSLERRELIRRRGGTAVADDLQYSFRHALVRDVAYAQIPHAERARQHLLAARWIESLGRPEDHSETIAHHYLQALEYTRDGGSAFADRARHALRDAGDRTVALNSFAAAERFYAAALELGGASQRDRAELVFRLGRARCLGTGGGVELLDDAAAEFVALHEHAHAAEAEALVARTLFMRGEADVASLRFERAAALLRGEPASPSKAFVLSTLAAFQMARDRGREAIDTGREALAMADELGLDELRASAQTTIGTARVASGDLGGIEDLRAAIEIARPKSPELVRAQLNLGSVLANIGQLDEAFAVHERGRRAAEELGDPGRVRWFDAERAYQLYWRGRAEEALQVADQILTGTEAGSPHLSHFDGWLIRGWVALDRGEVADAVAHADRALEMGRAFGEPQLLFPALAFHARASLAAGAVDRADAEATELLDAWRARASTPSPSFWVGELALVLHELGRGDELGAIAARNVPTPWLNAALAVCRGERETARKLYVELGSIADAERLTSAPASLRAGAQAPSGRPSPQR